MTLVYITCKDKKEAEKISMHLLRKRIIACANMFPIKSMYWWNYKIANENENAIIAKTSEKNFKKLVKEVRNVHSYKIPCILKINAKANADFEAWANKETS
ncbi:divalent-cation tolerance protein CutA [Candidatus Woesearchaeota archaeon]|nr:divalent-cation tolerance protein CutA [Candidatus Woesearchaeota archaeon]